MKTPLPKIYIENNSDCIISLKKDYGMCIPEVPKGNKQNRGHFYIPYGVSSMANKLRNICVEYRSLTPINE